MYINQEGYLCRDVQVNAVKSEEVAPGVYKTPAVRVVPIYKTIKYKVNKEGLFEEVKEIKEELVGNRDHIQDSTGPLIDC